MSARMLTIMVLALSFTVASGASAHEELYDGILTLPAGISSFSFQFEETGVEPLSFETTKSQHCKSDGLTKVYLHRPHSNAWVLATYSRGQIFSTLKTFDGIRLDFDLSRAGQQTCRIKIEYASHHKAE